MSNLEQKCWQYLLENPGADWQALSINCDVDPVYAKRIISRIGTPDDIREKLDGVKRPKPERVKLMEAGISMTAGSRDETYGAPWDNLTKCAELWESYMSAKYMVKVDLTAEDVAHMMQLVKMARTFHGGYHADNYTDNATYGAIAGECRKIEEDLQ